MCDGSVSARGCIKCVTQFESCLVRKSYIDSIGWRVRKTWVGYIDFGEVTEKWTMSRLQWGWVRYNRFWGGLRKMEYMKI